MPNIYEPEFDQIRDREGFTRRRAFVGRQAGSERLGISVWEIGPGEAAYPYHFHFGEEEAAIVLEGRLSLRTPDGWRELERGEVVSFPTGPEGAHQLVNRSQSPARLLALSSGGGPEVVVYPDSNKIGAYSRTLDDAEIRELYDRASAVDYWQGEAPPAADEA